MSGEDSLGLVGTTIAEKYAVESLVGEGGFAVVYRAMHLVWKRPVALKVFKALLSMNLPKEGRDAMMNEFIEEGGLLTDLSTQTAAIVQARDVGMHTMASGETVPYMVLEWLEGESLEDTILHERQKGFPPRDITQCVNLLEPAVLALGLAHGKGIAHRDIKPANFFVIGDARSQQVSIKLLDFGIAKVVQDAQKRAGSFQKTTGAITSFTPMYGAPEQFNRSYGATGPWTDVFALSLMLTELLSHCEALPGDDLVQLGFASANPNERPTPRLRGAIVTDSVEAVFLRALSVRPEERFQNASEFWYALKRAASITLTGPTSGMSGTLVDPLSGTLVIASTSQPELPTYASQGGSSSPQGGVPFTAPHGAPSHAQRPGYTLPSGQPHVEGDPGSGKSRLGLVVGLVGIACVAGLGYLGYEYYKEEHADPKGLRGIGSALPSATATAAAPPEATPTCPANMVLIQGAEFLMGSGTGAKAAEDDEKPAHSIRLSPYCLDITEVTVKRFADCTSAGKCLKAPLENDFEGITPALRKVYDPLCTANKADTHAEHPINCVTWEEATRFCTRMIPGGRLPTEAEWEFAARGSDQRTYPWGEEAPSAQHLNACGTECMEWVKGFPAAKSQFKAMYDESDGYPNTSPVGRFPKGKTKHGVLDIVGNVYEWVQDWYGDYPNAGVNDTQTDPHGPSNGSKRVIRGGAWNGSDPAWVRPAQRFTFQPSARSHGIGFRCARPLAVPDAGK